MMIGRTIMLPTTHIAGIKGVKSRTFINVTIGKIYMNSQSVLSNVFKRFPNLSAILYALNA